MGSVELLGIITTRLKKTESNGDEREFIGSTEEAKGSTKADDKEAAAYANYVRRTRGCCIVDSGATPPRRRDHGACTQPMAFSIIPFSACRGVLCDAYSWALNNRWPSVSAKFRTLWVHKP